MDFLYFVAECNLFVPVITLIFRLKQHKLNYMKKIGLIWITACLLGTAMAQQPISDSERNQSVKLINIITQESITLQKYLAEKAVVLVFHSINCPFATAYEEKLLKISTEYQSNAISFILVDSPNGQENEGIESIKKHHQKSVLKNWAYYTEPENKLVKQFGIKKVPEVVVLKNINKNFVVFYTGAIDNNHNPREQATETYLTDALKSLINNSSPKVKSKRATGCAVEDY
jgi:thiol-disulfide isomerase/thioredoxin